MKPFKFFLICVFTMGLFFVFNTKLEAATTYDMCIYSYPDDKYGKCKLYMYRKNSGGPIDAIHENKFKVMKEALRAHKTNGDPGVFRDLNWTIEAGPCASDVTVNSNVHLEQGQKDKKKINIQLVLPNTTHDADFYTSFENKFEKNNKCPTVYAGTQIYNCTMKNKDASGEGYGSERYCLFAYVNKEKVSGRKKMILDEERINVTKDEFDEAFDEQKEEAKDTHSIPKEKAKQLVDDAGLSQITIGNVNFTCKKLIGDDLLKYLRMIFTLIRILTPIILIVMGMLDFTKAISSNSQDAIQQATQKFAKRMIVCVIIFLIPTIIEFLMNLTGISDGTCGL